MNEIRVFLTKHNGLPYLKKNHPDIKNGIYQYILSTPHFKTKEEAEEAMNKINKLLEQLDK
jgi:hypothetical protein